ncbi:MAG: hypothetical protein EOO25_00320 [Comamonadaceae bacterium]|nr:MAG: hypothetical protein EOO25_00320 [Comamonadaceae bacterium]
MKLLTLIAALAVCSAVSHAQTIERVKMSDNDLNCQQVFDEIRQMEAVISRAAAPGVTAAAPGADPNAGANAAVGAQMAGAVAQQAMATGGFGGFGGFGGMLSGLVQAAGAHQASQQAAAQQTAALQAQQNAVISQQAQGRKEHLTTVFLSKGCKMGDVAK